MASSIRTLPAASKKFGSETRIYLNPHKADMATGLLFFHGSKTANLVTIIASKHQRVIAGEAMDAEDPMI